MTTSVAALVLIAALAHAVWNALLKSGRDRLVIQALVMGTSSAMVVPLMILAPAPAPASWPFIALSATIHVGYFFFLLKAYQWGDLSHVYPIARGAAPLLVSLLAVPLAAERLPAGGMAGVALVSAGILSLAFGRGTGVSWRPAAFALATAGTIAAYTVTDGLGVRVSGSPLGYIAWLLFLSGLPLCAFTAWRRRGTLRGHLRRDALRGITGGVLATVAYGIVIWALGRAPMAHVSALRETSVLFGALIGAVVLREGFGARRVAASVLIATGVALLHVAG